MLLEKSTLPLGAFLRYEFSMLIGTHRIEYRNQNE
jgi:hypothetical protein